MKRILVVLFASFMVLSASAQKDTSLRKASIAICNCFEKQNLNDLKTAEEYQGVFIKCMMDSAMGYFTNAMAEASDPATAGKEMAEKVAMDLVSMGCKPFMTIAMKMSGQAETGDAPPAVTTKKEPEANLKNVSGEVIKTEERDFLYITVKTAAGREHVLVYMQYVPNSDTWMKEPLKLKGRKVSVKWIEYEVYQTKIKQFSNIKELKELSLL